MLHVTGTMGAIDPATTLNGDLTSVVQRTGDMYRRILDIPQTFATPFMTAQRTMETTESEQQNKFLNAASFMKHIRDFGTGDLLYELLPPEAVDSINIKVTKTVFERGTLAGTPQGSVPRLFTHTQDEQHHTLVRKSAGIVVHAEQLYSTPGQEIIRQQIVQIAHRITDADTYEILNAIVRNHNAKAEEHIASLYSDPRQYHDAFMMETDRWNLLKKRTNGIYDLINYFKKIALRNSSAPLDSMLISDECVGYLSTSKLSAYYESGPRGPAFRERGIETKFFGNSNEFKLYPVRSFACMPEPDVMNSEDEIGELYPMEPAIRDAKNYHSRMCSIKLPDDATRSWFNVELLDAVENAPIWDREDPEGVLIDVTQYTNNLSDEARESSILEFRRDPRYGQDINRNRRLFVQTMFAGQIPRRHLHENDIVFAANVLYNHVDSKIREVLAITTPKIVSYLNTMARINPHDYPDYWNALIQENVNAGLHMNQGEYNRPMWLNLANADELAADPVTNTLRIPAPPLAGNANFPQLPPHPDFNTLRACAHLLATRNLAGTVWENAKETFNDMKEFVYAFTAFANALHTLIPDSPFLSPRYTHSQHHTPTLEVTLFENLFYPDIVPLGLYVEVPDAPNADVEPLVNWARANGVWRADQAGFIDEELFRAMLLAPASNGRQRNIEYDNHTGGFVVTAAAQQHADENVRGQAGADMHEANQKLGLFRENRIAYNALVQNRQARRRVLRTPMSLSYDAVRAYMAITPSLINAVPMNPINDEVPLERNAFDNASHWLDDHSVNYTALAQRRVDLPLLPHAAKHAVDQLANRVFDNRPELKNISDSLVKMCMSREFTQRYEMFWKTHTDPIMRLLCLLYLSVPITRRSMHALVYGNVPLPIGFTIVRPHMRYVVRPIILMAAGKQTGKLYIRPPITEAGMDPSRQVHELSITFYHAAHVLVTENIIQIRDAFVHSHIRGASNGWILPHEYNPNNYQGDGSMISIVHGLHEYPRGYMSLAGNFSAIDSKRFNSAMPFFSNDSYSTAPVYRGIFNLNSINRTSNRDESNIYSDTQILHNFVCFPGLYKTYSVQSQDISTLVPSTGHWKDQADFSDRLHARL